jgi:DNA-binding beta-propeller fold protein YncE
MKKLLPILALVIMALVGCSEDPASPPSEQTLNKNLDQDIQALALDGRTAIPARGRAVIANRGSGTISVIDANDLSVSGTHELPAEMGEPTPEPMYVVHISAMQRVFVGDRANNRVAVFNARSFEVVGTVPAGAGVFHMWGDLQGNQLWVNNDIDKTTTVIDPANLEVVATVPTPGDLVAMGGKPHDVILGPKGRFAYVSVLGVAGANDYVVQFETDTFTETARATVGKDPHLSLARQHRWLYVPCQNSDQVVVLDRFTLEQETVISLPGAHGAAMAPNGKHFYATNLPGGGTGALQAINTSTNMLAGAPADTPYPVPHNLALDANGKTMFVTHSGGASDKVTVYRVGGQDPTPQYLGEVTVGLNPFGLTYVR